MSEIAKTLKEELREIFLAWYYTPGSPVMLLKATEKPKAHQVTDTTTQQEVKS